MKEGEGWSLVSGSGREESSGTLEERNRRGEEVGRRGWRGEIRIQLVLHCGSN